MIVRELVTKLGFQVDESKMNGYNRKVDNIKNSADAAANSLRGMLAAFVGLSAIKSISDTADKMQSMEARVGMLPQTITSAADAFDTVADRASAARSSIEAYGSFYVKLQNAGKKYIQTQEEGLQITDTITKALVVGGATAQEQSSALLQFGQAIGSGVFQGDEFRAMAEAAPQFMDELALAMNIPRENMKNLASEGKITSKTVIEAVKKMSTVFEERFKQMPMTVNQATTIIGNRWSKFINRLNRESHTVTKVADFFLGAFNKIEKGLDGLVDFFGGSTNTIKFFGIALAAALAPSVFGLIAGGIALVLSPVGLLVAGLMLLGLVIEDVYQFFTGGESILGDFVEWLNSGSVAANTVKIVLVALTGAVIAFGIAAAAAWVAALSPIMLIILALMGLWLAFGIFHDQVIQIFSDMWEKIKTNTLEFWEYIKSIFTWDNLFAGLKSAWEKAKSLVGLGTETSVNVTPATAAGAAASPSGVPGVGGGSTQNVTVNQTLPPGTTKETADAARSATVQAVKSADNTQMARQMGQAQ